MTLWDPSTYLRYAGERERPFWELVARIPHPSPRVVVDLGCGPGTATVGLCERWPGASVLGVDSSEEMVEQAATLARPGRLRFERRDVRTWEPEAGGVDVLLSNATLQWVPDHRTLFPRWWEAVRPGGVLAFQVPGNFAAPSHNLLREVATSPRWGATLEGVGERLVVPEPVDYYRSLRALGAMVDVWETTYLHALVGPDPILAWVRGTALRPYLSALGPADAAELSAEYAARLREAYPPEPSGETLFPFRRIFAVAVR